MVGNEVESVGVGERKFRESNSNNDWREREREKWADAHEPMYMCRKGNKKNIVHTKFFVQVAIKCIFFFKCLHRRIHSIITDATTIYCMTVKY